MILVSSSFHAQSCSFIGFHDACEFSLAIVHWAAGTPYPPSFILQGIAGPLELPIFSAHFWQFLSTLPPLDQCSKCLSEFWHCRALVSRLPTFASLFVELLLTNLSRFLATNDLAWKLPAVLSISLPDDVYPSAGFSFSKVNCVKPVHLSRMCSPGQCISVELGKIHSSLGV